MEKVSGIGGFFFRARDPEAISAWYREHLGVPAPVWSQEAGPTVLAPFPEDTDYFGAASGEDAKMWMINFRVRDLDAMLAQLAGAGIVAETRMEWNSEIGRFARIHDPEGNPIELWEPAGAAAE